MMKNMIMKIYMNTDELLRQQELQRESLSIWTPQFIFRVQNVPQNVIFPLWDFYFSGKLEGIPQEGRETFARNYLIF